MRILVADLIQIGVRCGLETAERVYLSLAQEPRDAQHNAIDWLTIRTEIARQRAV